MLSFNNDELILSILLLKKASKDLGWEASTSLEELVIEMIQEDLSIAKKEIIISKEGFKINSPK